MKILMTGATGYVGTPTARLLAEQGHEISAVVRRADRGAALPEGTVPVLADLGDPAALLAAARGMDVVLHMGFPDTAGDWPAAVAIEARLVAALAEALRGGATRLVVANGTIFLDGAQGPIPEDALPIPGHPASARAAATAPATATNGLRGAEVRLASFVHGRGGSIFLPILVAAAKATGQSIYVGDGAPRLSAVHVDDAARAFALAATAEDATGIFHVASDESPTLRQLARAVAQGTGATPLSVSPEDAAARTDPFTAMFLQADNRLSTLRAREVLGWRPEAAETLIWDVAFGSYAEERGQA